MGKKKRTDGAIHAQNAKIVLVFLAIVSVSLTLLTRNLWYLGLIVGGIGGLLVTPDVDHSWETTEEWRIKRISELWGTLHRFYWSPYEILLPHRSVLSHGGFGIKGAILMVVVSCPLRMLYAILWTIPIIYFFSGVWLCVKQISVLFWITVWAGWAGQDFVHWIRDYLFSRKVIKYRINYRGR